VCRVYYPRQFPKYHILAFRFEVYGVGRALVYYCNCQFMFTMLLCVRYKLVTFMKQYT